MATCSLCDTYYGSLRGHKPGQWAVKKLIMQVFRAPSTGSKKVSNRFRPGHPRPEGHLARYLLNDLLLKKDQDLGKAGRVTGLMVARWPDKVSAHPASAPSFSWNRYLNSFSTNSMWP
jgi:hypothetical protein